MADAQKFLVTKPAGKPYIGVADIIDMLTTDVTLPPGSGVSVIAVPDTDPVTTILPWRIVYHGDTTLAALDHYPTEDEVFAALVSLQRTAGHANDSLSDLSVTHQTAAI